MVKLMWKIKLFESDFTIDEVRVVGEVVESGWLTNGARTLEFEESIASLIRTDPSAVAAVSSCTAALHMAVIASGCGPGDEIVTTPLTFVSDFNVISVTGADITLADVESMYEWAPSVANIERALTSRTKAVMLTHFAGIPARETEAIAALCKTRGVVLIEDCAHALGAEIRGRNCGTWGDFGAFSFYSNKNISTGEGGALWYNTEIYPPSVRSLRTHGMNTSTLDRDKGRAFSYDVERAGLNYRIDEMRAALGVVQMGRFAEKHDKRSELVERYRERISDLGLITPFLSSIDERRSVNHIMPVLLPSGISRERALSYFTRAGIQISYHYPAPWSFKAYRHLENKNCENARLIFDSEITLPLHTQMTLPDVDLVCETLGRLING